MVSSQAQQYLRQHKPIDEIMLNARGGHVQDNGLKAPLGKSRI
jgi:hypothetical protein